VRSGQIFCQSACPGICERARRCCVEKACRDTRSFPVSPYLCLANCQSCSVLRYQGDLLYSSTNAYVLSFSSFSPSPCPILDASLLDGNVGLSVEPGMRPLTRSFSWASVTFGVMWLSRPLRLGGRGSTSDSTFDGWQNPRYCWIKTAAHDPFCRPVPLESHLFARESGV
jgi:hypothetical protein